MADSDDARFERVGGKETTWILQCFLDGEWKAFCGLFVANIEDAEPKVARAKADRPDIDQWRAYDVATQTVLAEY